ncbi:hypothetical protein H0R92_11245 [Treponema sp. OMZ 840]|uniref:hypothetical protein n=1 Tax=Treponema sp. OMZ 840 TaxID=244313 RepID=UPI003D8D3176
MNIYINSVKADFILEDEKTLGDVLKAFQIECEKNEATIVSVEVDGFALKAEQMDSIFDRAITNIQSIKIETITQSDIMRALQDTGSKISVLSNELEQLSVLLQSGKDAKVSVILTSFADLFDILCRTVSLCSLFPHYFDRFLIDGQSPLVFLRDFSPVLSDFEKSLSDADTVLTGDLAEYEIVPRLRSFVAAVQSFGENRC